MAGTRGLRTYVGGSWRNPLYARAKKTPVPIPQRSAEEIEASTQRFLAMIDQRRQSNGQKALEKLVDREARTVVEGDTDLNHDNLEGGE
jgi:hypothetical protein